MMRPIRATASIHPVKISGLLPELPLPLSARARQISYSRERCSRTLLQRLTGSASIDSHSASQGPQKFISDITAERVSEGQWHRWPPTVPTPSVTEFRQSSEKMPLSKTPCEPRHSETARDPRRVTKMSHATRCVTCHKLVTP